MVNGEFKFDASGSAVNWRAFTNGVNTLSVVNGGTFLAKGKVSVGLKGNEGKRTSRFLVDGAGSLFEIGSTASAFSGVTAVDIEATNGGEFRFLPAVTMSFGGDSESTENRTGFRASGAGSKIDLSRATVLYVYRKGSFTVEDGAQLIVPPSFYPGYKGVTTEETVITVRGEGSKFLIPKKSDHMAEFYPGYRGTGTLNLEGGFIGGTEDNDGILFRCAASDNSVFTLNQSGGEISISNPTYDQFYISFRGCGTYNLSGGLLHLKCAFSDCYATSATEGRTTVFNQTGGTAWLEGGLNLNNTQANAANRTSALRLDGGVMKVRNISAGYCVKRGYTGTTTMSADGGTLKPTGGDYNAANQYFFGEFDVCTLGVKGLTVDTDGFNAYVKQDIANLGAAAGVLRKSGAGTLTCEGALTASKLVIDGGTFVFADAASAAAFTGDLVVTNGATVSFANATADISLASLVIDNGTVILPNGRKLVVSGSTSVSGLTLRYATAVAEASELDFLSAAGELDENTKWEIRHAVSSVTIPGGTHPLFVLVYDSGSGRTTAKFVCAVDAEPIGVADTTVWQGGAAWGNDAAWSAGTPTAGKKAAFTGAPADGAVTVPTGAVVGALEFAGLDYTLSDASLEVAADQGANQVKVVSGNQTVAAPVVFAATTEIPVTGGASLSFTGAVDGFGLAKTGNGVLAFEGPSSFTGEARLEDGIVRIADASALAGMQFINLSGGATLELDAEGAVHGGVFQITAANQAVPAIIKADRDAVITSFTGAKGFIKRGAAKLTLDVTEAAESSNLTTGKAPGTGDLPSNSSITYFPDDGSAPAANGWSGFTVAEGEFAVKGTAESPAVTATGTVSVGLNATNMDENAQAKLTIDGAKFDNYTTAGYLCIGAGTSRQYGRQFFPTLRIVNGAVARIYGIRNGYDTWGGSGRHAMLAVTNSTVYTHYTHYLSCSVAANNAALIRAKDSAFYVQEIFQLQGFVDADFDNCTLMTANLALTPQTGLAKLRCDSYNYLQPGGTLAFRNGTVLRAYLENFAGIQNALNFIFDDAEWVWDAAGATHTFAASEVNGALFTLEMQGEGLILRPAAGATYTTEVPFRGEGGFRNLGAGTVKFGAGTVKFTGTCYTAAGATTDLSDAGTVSGAAFAGTGTVKGATVESPKLVLDAAADWSVAGVPTFDAASFSGKGVVDFGRTAENPLDEPARGTSILVAKYVNGEPGVIDWKIVNTGLKTYSATMTAANGEIRLKPFLSGCAVLLR